MRSLVPSLAAPCAALLIWLAAAAAPGVQFQVDTPFDGADRSVGDGLCATRTGQCTLRAAVQESNALEGADEIVLLAGGYELTIAGVGEDAAATGDLDVTGPLVISGAGAGRSVLVNRGAGRLFDVRTTQRVVISGMSLRGGDATGEGSCGPVPLEGGGAICGNATISACAIENNNGNYGGGLFGFFTISDSTIAGNTGGFGGGMVSGGGNITNTVIRNNSGSLGGGIVNFGGQLTVERSAIINNSGAGIYTTQGGRLSVRNTTISGNSGIGLVDQGGCDGSEFCTPATVAVLNNVTITENDGGGVFALILVLPEGSRFSPLSMSNSILSGNTGDDCGGVITSLGHNIIRSNDCTFEQTGEGDLLGVDARLLALETPAGTTPHHVPAPNSPALDGGSVLVAPAPNDAPCESIDQLGRPRPSGAACDIGAIERDCSVAPGCDPPTRLPTSTATPSVTPTVPSPTPGPACAGDCNGDCEVTVDELVRGVNLSLTSGSVATCASLDRDGNGEVTVDELVRAVTHALSGCPSPGCPAP